MFLTFFVYILVLLILLMGACSDKSTHRISGWLSIIFCSFILGFRYDVGIDYISYWEYYNQYLYFPQSTEFSRELGYDYLNYLCAKLGLHSGVFFTITVFIQLSLIYLTFRNNIKLLFLVFFFYVTTGQLFGSLNIIRQAMAFCVFIYSIKYIEGRSLKKYLLCVLFACSFHTSSLILLPIYWIPRFWSITIGKLNNKWHLAIYIIISIAASLIFSFFLSSFSNILSESIYHNYVPDLGERNMKVNSGIGLMLFSFFDILIIWYGSRINILYPKSKLFYSIFYVGALLSKIFGLDMLLSRVAYDFVSLRMVMLAYLVLYFTKSNNVKVFVLRWALIFICLMIWVADILNGSSGCSPYLFNF